MLLVSFELANHANLTKATPVAWVSGWMGFRDRTNDYVLFDVWNDHFPGHPAAHSTALLALVAFVAAVFVSPTPT